MASRPRQAQNREQRAGVFPAATEAASSQIGRLTGGQCRVRLSRPYKDVELRKNWVGVADVDLE
jgi:hypothetical protein